jgi:phosphomethylpyrimidine synthase
MYQTQREAARAGLITGQMKQVAEKERMAPEQLRDLIATGQVVIPANRNHVHLNPEGVGQGLRTKINVNLGVSRDCYDFDYELQSD